MWGMVPKAGPISTNPGEIYLPTTYHLILGQALIFGDTSTLGLLPLYKQPWK